MGVGTSLSLFFFFSLSLSLFLHARRPLPQVVQAKNKQCKTVIILQVLQCF